MITTIVKDKQFLILTLETGRFYKYDFSTGMAYGTSKKPLVGTKAIYSKLKDIHEYYKEMFRYLDAHAQEQKYRQLCESLLSYPDLLPINFSAWMANDIIDNYNGQLPIGFVPWLRENNLSFLFENLQTYKAYKYYNDNLPPILAKKALLLLVNANIKLHEFIPLSYIPTIIKIIDNSVKTYQTSWLHEINQIVIAAHEDSSLFSLLDDTKTVLINYKIFKDWQEEKKAQMIEKALSKLSPVHEKEIPESNCVIIVPQGLKDLKDEGEQNHNCVGYFYNNSILEGENLIYFIRKKECPDKSYLTCRFKIKKQNTVEARGKHNSNLDSYEKNLVCTATDMIRRMCF